MEQKNPNCVSKSFCLNLTTALADKGYSHSEYQETKAMGKSCPYQVARKD